MSETITYTTQGTCSKQINIELEGETIKNIEFLGGCHGNLQGISSLCIGMNINDIIARLKGIRCGSKPTSCPDQLAICLETYVVEQAQKLHTL